jgi:transketolase
VATPKLAAMALGSSLPAEPPNSSILASVQHLRPVPDPTPPAPIDGEAASTRQLERWATVLRIDCVRMLAVAKSGHLDSSLSAADIVAALYHRVLRHDPSNPAWPARDRFVLSKGHAAPIQYAALARYGYFPLEDLMGLRKIGAQLQGHPDMNRTPGIEVSTGSLGQGLSMSLGIALALRLDGLDDQAQVFCLASDGDCQEGQTWEAATAAPHFGVANLTAIVDYNHLQTDGTTEEVMDIGDVRAKFESFGWDAVEIDGHDMQAIVEALERSRTLEQPAAIVCQTRKGRGVSSMEGRFGFHGKPPSPEQAEQALNELEATLAEQTEALEKVSTEFEALRPAPRGEGSD